MFRKENNKTFITWDDANQVVILKNKKIPFSDIKGIKLFASGIEMSLDELVRRLDSKNNYLDYFAMTSMEVELFLKSKAKIERITYYKTPFQASEKERLAYGQEVISLINKVNQMISVE
ncbi:hypothetical protein [Streptococcus uberis]|uniref:hypothetical protein n=1 Tax=Streptococcus uberis TaxID=1349 RepID=UPI001FF64884|nr:hypothetical protein [Streptococcus uberis]MCK1221014.1 hypothetical protein [Streptococcus uberis]MCK1259269.1 hypothetical protein [Streptococcus uberis]